MTGAAVLSGYFFGINEIALLVTGSMLVMAARLRPGKMKTMGALPVPPLAESGLRASPALAALPFGLPLLFLTFLKIGAVLYGSGYVLLAFLRADFVVRLGWLTDQQLLDAVAIGQITQGPVFTTATFIGFLLGGTPGALLATLGIFLPSFVFVALSGPLIPRMRSSPLTSGFLDGANASSFGLMAAVCGQLGRASLTDPFSILIALVSLGLLVRFRVNPTWLIAGGALSGLAASVIV